jgi:hypothetical protein
MIEQHSLFFLLLMLVISFVNDKKNGEITNLFAIATLPNQAIYLGRSLLDLLKEKMEISINECLAMALDH